MAAEREIAMLKAAATKPEPTPIKKSSSRRKNGATIKKALIDYGATTAGKANYKSLFSWDGIQEVNASFYDAMRDAAKLGGIDLAAEAAKTPRPPATAAPAASPSKAP